MKLTKLNNKRPLTISLYGAKLCDHCQEIWNGAGNRCPSCGSDSYQYLTSVVRQARQNREEAEAEMPRLLRRQTI